MNVETFEDLNGSIVEMVIDGETYCGFLHDVMVEEPQSHSNDLWYVSGELDASFIVNNETKDRLDLGTKYVDLSAQVFERLGLGEVTAWKWIRESDGRVRESKHETLGEVEEIRGLD